MVTNMLSLEFVYAGLSIVVQLLDCRSCSSQFLEHYVWFFDIASILSSIYSRKMGAQKCFQDSIFGDICTAYFHRFPWRAPWPHGPAPGRQEAAPARRGKQRRARPGIGWPAGSLRGVRWPLGCLGGTMSNGADLLRFVSYQMLNRMRIELLYGIDNK